jgi:GAF domain-containing protein/signal transduction histidine kinase
LLMEMPLSELPACVEMIVGSVMQAELTQQPDLKILTDLINLALSPTDQSIALQRFIEFVSEAMDTDVCNLVLLDAKERFLTQVACTGGDKKYEEFIVGKPIRMGSSQTGDTLDFNLFAKGEGGAMYNLQRDGQGIISPEVARKYGLNSAFSVALKLENRLIGYLNSFTSRTREFTAEEKAKLNFFARHAELIIDRTDKLEYNRTLERSTSISLTLQQSLMSVSADKFLQQVSEKACELLSVPICIVWKLHKQHGLRHQKRGNRSRPQKLKVVATVGDVDDEFRKIQLNLKKPNSSGIKRLLSSTEVRYLLDVTKPHPDYYQHSAEAKARGWVSLMTAPMWSEGRLIGMLDVYTKTRRYFKEWEKDFFKAFANYTALSIRKTELMRESEHNSSISRRLAKLSEIMQEVAETSDEKKLLALILDKSLELVGGRRGWISRYDLQTGQLHIADHSGRPSEVRPLKLGKGITGQALLNERPIRVDNVRSRRWSNIYEEFWKDTRSELAVPIIVRHAEIHVAKGIQYGSKLIGVINVESPIEGAFSRADEDILWSLARHAAIIIERLDVDEKLEKLRHFEKEIASKRDWGEAIKVVLKAITNTLGYDFVNISMVIPELDRIKSKYVSGIPRDQIEAFKKMADHSLDSGDIQADIVRTGDIEVPEVDDPRFDQDIYHEFGHKHLIRVFIPMKVPPDDQVIGTVEAGYRRSYRKHIYERDVRILNRFVISALEQKKRGLLPKISHEFTAPIVGIRSTANFLQRRIKMLEDGLVHLKFEDILTDCELLLHKVSELEHILGSSSSPPIPSKRELTVVYRDIIIKSINQLRPLVAERSFDMSRILYNTADIHRIRLYLDKLKLNSVVYNLLINSIKYAEDNPTEFKISINIDENKDNYILMFKDWGIGINEKYAERIFDDGFRAPEARSKNITGSGLGLTIARKIMHEFGGDLYLANNRKPTDFHLILPKSLKEAPSENIVH